MKILMAQNRYQIRGGEDESFDSESALLEKNGHHVIRYVRNNSAIGDIPAWKAGLRAIWSTEDYAEVRAIIQREKPDLLHVQNFFPLISPAIYYAAQAEGLPVIQALHNYRLWCLNAYFFRDGGVCELCINQPIPLSGIKYTCYRDSLLASSAIASMLVVHRLLRTWQRQVDTFIVLTEFAREKYIQGGLPAAKLAIKPNFVNPDPGMGGGGGNFALFVGRLSDEKGLSTLLEAWQTVNFDFPLKIVGDGPLAETIRCTLADRPAVNFLGRLPISEVHALMGDAIALIFPSLWFEGMPRVVIEAFAKGVPVIASKLGATATMIQHQINGLHFEPGNAADLVRQMEWMQQHPVRWAAMRRAARRCYEENFTAEANYVRLMSIYDATIRNHSRAEQSC